MSTKLSGLLAELKILQQKIEAEMTKTVKHTFDHRIKIFPDADDCEEMMKYETYLIEGLTMNDTWFLITITFHPQIAYQLDEYGQKQRLITSLSYFDQYNYYACLEKHMNGNLHAHVLILCDYHDVLDILHKVKRNVTTSVKLEPAVNIKPVKQTNLHIKRTYDYIVSHKKDHPHYKHLIFNN